MVAYFIKQDMISNAKLQANYKRLNNIVVTHNQKRGGGHGPQEENVHH